MLWQLRFSEKQEEIKRFGESIIGNIDENGYLRASLEEIIEETQTQRDIAEVARVTEVTVRNRYKELIEKLKIDVPL